MPARDPSAQRKRWTLIAAIVGSSLAFIDGTVANVAVPAIQHDFGASAADSQWVIEAYVLLLSALLLTGGALGDRIGRRRVFMFGAALFTAASVGCAMAPGIGLLIAARGVQGVGAAFMVPGSLALISSAFPSKERGHAIGTWSAATSIAGAAGPVLGGLLIDALSWRWAFLINVPLGLVLLAICAWRVPEAGAGHDAAGQEAAAIDFGGTLLATLALTGIVFALIEGPARGFASAPVLASALAGCGALVAFVWLEARLAAPMLPLGLFRRKDFLGTNLLTLLLYGALGGSLYFLPLNLIQVRHLGSTAAGAALMPMILILFALSSWMGKLSDRRGPRRFLIAGPLVAGAGFLLFATGGVDESYWLRFFPATCILGLGMSITVTPLTTTVMNSVPARLVGTASGINNAVSRAAGLLAVALFGVAMSWAFDSALDAALKGRIAQLAPSADLLQSVQAQRSRWAGMVLSGQDAATQAVRREVQEAFVHGFRVVMVASALLCLLAAAMAWLYVGRRATGKHRLAPGAGGPPRDH